MAGGSIPTNVVNGVAVRIYWTLISQSIENNTSTVSWQTMGDGSGTVGATTSHINGIQVGYSAGGAIAPGTLLSNGTYTIQHNADGTGTIGCAVVSSAYGATLYGGTAWTLPTIPRTSTISATNANVGAASTISISRATTSYKDTLRYSFDGLTGTIVSKTSNNTVNWTIPNSFYNKLTTVSSKTCTIYCDTYNGNTLVGTNSCTITISVPDSSKPTVSCTVVDTNSATTAITRNNNTIVLGASNAQYTITASAKNGASIASYAIQCGSETQTTASGTFNGAQSGTFSILVTDSRGLTATATVTKTTVNYIVPTITLECDNISATGECPISVNGNYFNGNIGSTANTLTLQYRFKTSGDYGNWTALNTTKSGNTYSCSYTITGLDYTKATTFQCRIIDQIYTINSAEITKTSVPIFEWDKTSFQFNVPVSMPTLSIGGESLADRIVEIGTYIDDDNGIYWYWRKRASGEAEASGIVNYSGVNIGTAWGNLYRSSIMSASFPSGVFADGGVLICSMDSFYDDCHIIGFQKNGVATDTGVEFRILSGQSYTNQYVGVTFHLIGDSY